MSSLETPPCLVDLVGGWDSNVMFCLHIHKNPPFNATSFDILANQCSVKSSKWTKAWNEWNFEWSICHILVLLTKALSDSRTWKQPPQPYSTRRQTFLTRVFFSLLNTSKVSYIIIHVWVSLFRSSQLSLFFFFLLQRQPVRSQQFLLNFRVSTFQVVAYFAYVSSFPRSLEY